VEGLVRQPVSGLDLVSPEIEEVHVRRLPAVEFDERAIIQLSEVEGTHGDGDGDEESENELLVTTVCWR
jgi:hypothetical protein